jgi:uncharacterized protein (TIGR02594 family)
MATKISDWRIAHGGKITYGSDSAGVLLVQRALLASGAQLVDDGEWGEVSEAAIKRFQSSHYLPPTGWVGTRTAILLDQELADTPVPKALPSVLQIAPWLSYMRAITGTKELPGAADSEIILAWSQDIAKEFPDMAKYSRNYKHDATPWCGQAMAWAMAKASIRPPFGDKETDCYLYAQSWAKWERSLAQPIPGCVLVFSRAGGGHVTLCEKVDGKRVWCRGGNQSDMVNVITKTLDDSFLGARWPSAFPIPTTAIAGDISNVAQEGSLA